MANGPPSTVESPEEDDLVSVAQTPPVPEDAAAYRKVLGEKPWVHPDATLKDCRLGPWTAVGARTKMQETSMGAYSYIVDDCQVTYATIGKFCSIAAHSRLNPGNHPTWRAALHHFSYRSRSYELAEDDDSSFFEWRRADWVTLDHDVWIGHGSTVMPGVRIATGAVVGAGSVVTRDVPAFTIVAGVPARVIRPRFDKATEEGLLAIAWWHWSHDTLAAALEDFRSLSAEEFVKKYR